MLPRDCSSHEPILEAPATPPLVAVFHAVQPADAADSGDGGSLRLLVVLAAGIARRRPVRRLPQAAAPGTDREAAASAAAGTWRAAGADRQNFQRARHAPAECRVVEDPGRARRRAGCRTL